MKNKELLKILPDPFVGKKSRINLRDIDVVRWSNDLRHVCKGQDKPDKELCAISISLSHSNGNEDASL